MSFIVKTLGLRVRLGGFYPFLRQNHFYAEAHTHQPGHFFSFQDFSYLLRGSS